MTEVARFQRKELTPGVNFSTDQAAILVCDDSLDPVRAFENVCQHNGGSFVSAGGCMLRCPRHDWLLDGFTGEYVNPSGLNKSQPELKIESRDEAVVLTAESNVLPLADSPARELDVDELVLEYLSHAGMTVSAGPTRIVFDPWCCGPAFSTGWWLKHRVRSDWAEHIAGADSIYISHSHPDHLNEWSIRRILDQRQDAHFLVPAFESNSVETLLTRWGATNITSVAFNTRIDLGPSLFGFLINDHSGREDSGIYLNYKGHSILNVVDCPFPNGGRLPKVDYLLSSFAGGASGFPVCWQDQYGDDGVRRRAARSRAAVLESIRDRVAECSPRFFLPFAGFFEELDPADAYIRASNKKNSFDDVVATLERSAYTRETSVLEIFEGWTHDVSTGRPSTRDLSTDFFRDHDINHYKSIIGAAENTAPLSAEEVKNYFLGAGFSDKLVFDLQLVSEDYSGVFRRFIFDFHTGLLIKPEDLQARQKSHKYLSAKFRSDRFTHVLRNRLPIEELTIGFQGRFSRSPDVYNFEFWDHFQNSVVPADAVADQSA